MDVRTWGSLVVVATLAACGGEDRRIVGEGETCEELADCAAGLVCASDARCRIDGTPGTAAAGDACFGTAECRLGLACASDGTCAPLGDPGTTAFGESCAADDACQRGLTCADDGVCRGLQLPLWAGASCDAPAESAEPFRVFFEVPGDEPLADFYRLPYPNDIRLDSSGRVDLAGHPSPGALIPEVGDAVGNLVRVVEQDVGGFGPNQAIFFRFSQFPDAAKLVFGLPGTGTIALVDLTPGAAEAGNLPFRYELRSSRTPYICENWLAMHPIDGRPLEPGKTYAAVLSTSIESKGDDERPGGVDLVPDADFAPLIADTAPADARLLDAWNDYAPLRAWASANAIDPARIAAAAVFTVVDPTERPRLVREAALAQPVAELADVAVCGVADPFAVAGDESRGCTTPSDSWTELQGLVSLPIFQSGTPPYKDFGDGGAIDTSRGAPTVVRSESVHVALTIPKGVDMPPAGWPVIVYAHGTGGSYTSFLREGLAERFTEVQIGVTPVHFAMISFDAPMHGPRAHPENHDPAWLAVDPNAYDPDVLFFNPLNVRAARDNVLQQAADTWALVRWLASIDVGADDSPTGGPLRFDVDNVFYLGHSQGGTVGPLAVAWEPEFDGVVLSGAGGLLIQTLVAKTSPNDLPQALRVGLADPSISRVHPVLNLVQQAAESTDGVNHARYVLRQPPEGSTSRSVFQVYGVGDTYTPDTTQYALARQLGLDQVTNGQTPLATIDEVALPAKGNAAGGATGVVALYPALPGRDAHFVLFDRTDAPLQAATFLGSAVVDGVPTVIAP